MFPRSGLYGLGQWEYSIKYNICTSISISSSISIINKTQEF